MMPNILDATVAYLDDCLHGLDEQLPPIWVTAAKADKESYQVVIRDDGGELLEYPRATAHLGINIYAPTESEADLLANYVRWALSEWADARPVLLATPSLPHQIADITPRRYLTAELTILLGKTNI